MLGTFGLYWPEPRAPTPQHLQIINQVVRLVAFAIERKRSQDAISESEHLAQGQLKVLTRTLDALVQESDPERLLEHVLKVIIEQLAAHSVSVGARSECRTADLIAILQSEQFQTAMQADYPVSQLPSTSHLSPIWSEILRNGQHAVLRTSTSPLRECALGQGETRGGFQRQMRATLILPHCVFRHIYGIWASDRFCLCRC